MNDICPSCGRALTIANRSTLVCRRCAQDYERERLADELRKARQAFRRKNYMPDNGGWRVAGTVKEGLENTLLRLDHNWNVTRSRNTLFGQVPSLAMTCLTSTVGLLAFWAGYRSLLLSVFADAISLGLIALGIVWPTYAIYKSWGYRRARREYLQQRADIVSQIACIPDTPPATNEANSDTASVAAN